MADHPVKVPQNLMGKWMDDWFEDRENADVLLMQAAQYGADQELEACCEWFDAHIPGYEMVVDRLRAARRPKPPSLAEQGIAALETGCSLTDDGIDIIKAALQRLAELEAKQ